MMVRCLVVAVVLGMMLMVSYADPRCGKVTTFNAGLTSAVAKVNSRMSNIKKAIETNGADVMCLQEVWYERSLQSIIDGTSRTYPYHYSALHSKVGELRSTSPFDALGGLFNFFLSGSSNTDAPCTSGELSYIMTDLVGCAVAKGCMGGNGNAVGSCMAQNCKNQLKSSILSQSCMSCMMFSLANLRETVVQCTRAVGGFNNRFNGPGLVLLSKYPITSIRYNKFHPFSKLWVERGYLQAQIKDVGTVVCTHLSARFDQYMEFDTWYDSYEQQQAAEVRALSRIWYRQHILMGDLNTGPGYNFTFLPWRNVKESYPQNYESLMSYGYRDPYVEQSKECTFCRDNQYVEGNENYILDHVLFKGDDFRAFRANRAMMRYGGQTLSDHYGVEVNYCTV